MTNNMKALRESRKMTQRQLAEAIGNPDVDVPMISRFEACKCVPTPATLRDIAKALNCTERDIYGRSEQTYLRDIIAFDETVEPQSFEVLELVERLKKKGPVQRWQLAAEMDVSDRKMRSIIEDARRCGYIIINKQDGKGYYLSAKISDIEKQYKQDKARALSILSRMKFLRDALIAEGLNY